MLRLRNYRIGFDIRGVILFLTVMLPNFIWFAFPAANDVLRNESMTPALDTVASVYQAVMVASLCFMINKARPKPMNRALLTGTGILIILYYAGWCLYYAGNASPAVILDLCIAPCLAFILFSAAGKNLPAMLSAGIFAVCHLVYGIVNFIL